MSLTMTKNVLADNCPPVLHDILIARTVIDDTAALKKSIDQKQMLAYQQGDITAFDALYSTHKDALYRFVLRHGLNTDQADEVYQEIWSAVIKSRLNYRPDAKFNTWLYQIARNKISDHYRTTKAQLTLVDAEIDAMPDVQEETPIGNIRERLLGTLNNIPFIQRQTFLMYYEAALSIADIAYITETEQEAVKSRLRYAVKKLKSSLGNNNA